MSDARASCDYVIATSDADLGLLLRVALASRGLRSQVVCSGPEAVTKAIGQSPTGVILQRELPGYGAEDVIRQLQAFEATRYLPVIVLLHRSRDPADFPVVRVGVDHVVTLPVSLSRLFETVDRVERLSQVDVQDA